ncbi:MOSC domain-containing protein [Candidatus Acetothermia bacterium]|nr:MOSC domain-containing protein [Candidatus Acetothermia bacterium]
MWKGTVVSINIAPEAAKPIVSVNEVRAVKGKGLEGDRYFKASGTFSEKLRGPDHEVTLIEIEAIEALRRDYKVELSPGEARRNIVTRGVPLSHLVGKEFKIGSATLRGLRLCEPCSHLEGLTKEGVKSGLKHRGGLRAQILSDGVIRAGDAIHGE